MHLKTTITALSPRHAHRKMQDLREQDRFGSWQRVQTGAPLRVELLAESEDTATMSSLAHDAIDGVCLLC